MRRLILSVCILLISFGTGDAATVNYLEDTDGEFSGDHNAPTDLGVLGVGNNIVSGTVTDVGLDFDVPFYLNTADIFTFEVPLGTTVDQMFLRSFSSSSSFIFMGVDDTDTFFFSPEDINNFPSNQTLDAAIVARGIIGEPDDVDSPGADPDSGANLFDNLGGPANSFGPGNYTVYLQETSDSSDYTLNFRVVSAVPEPSSVGLFSLCSLLAISSRRRKSARLPKRRMSLNG